MNVEMKAIIDKYKQLFGELHHEVLVLRLAIDIAERDKEALRSDSNAKDQEIRNLQTKIEQIQEQITPKE